MEENLSYLKNENSELKEKINKLEIENNSLRIDLLVALEERNKAIKENYEIMKSHLELFEKESNIRRNNTNFTDISKSLLFDECINILFLELPNEKNTIDSVFKRFYIDGFSHNHYIHVYLILKTYNIIDWDIKKIIYAINKITNYPEDSIRRNYEKIFNGKDKKIINKDYLKFFKYFNYLIFYFEDWTVNKKYQKKNTVAAKKFNAILKMIDFLENHKNTETIFDVKEALKK